MFVIVRRYTEHNYNSTYPLTYVNTEDEAKALCDKLNEMDTTISGYNDWAGEWYEYESLIETDALIESVRKAVEEDNIEKAKEREKDLEQNKTCLETLIKAKAFFDQFDLENITDFVPLIPQMYEAYKATDMSLPISFFDGRYFYRKDGITERAGEVPYGTRTVMIHVGSSYSHGYFIHNEYDIADDIETLKQEIERLESEVGICTI